MSKVAGRIAPVDHTLARRAALSSTSPVVLHVGLHKTGTTFLQRNVFPVIPEVTTLYRKSAMSRFIGLPPDRLLVVTDEGISGSPFKGRWVEEFEQNVLFLKNVFRTSAVIIGFRSHAQLLISLYKQYLHVGGTERIGVMFDPISDGGIIKKDDLRFSPRIEFLKKHFEHVFVHTQEELDTNFANFLDDLTLFLGTAKPEGNTLSLTRRNVGVRGAAQADLLMYLNRIDSFLRSTQILPTLQNPLFKILGLAPRHLCQRYLSFIKSAPVRLSPDVEDFINTRYADDWQEVVAATQRRREDIVRGESASVPQPCREQI